MTDLITWLGVVLEAEERDLRDARMDDGPPWWQPVWLTRERLLAEVAAKRAILDLHPLANHPQEPILYCETCEYVDQPDEPYPVPGWPCPTLRALAAPYSHLPGYQEDWKP